MTVHPLRSILFVLVAFACGCATSRTARYDADCYRTLRPVRLQARTRPAVVRVSSGGSSGTGFLLRVRTSKLLVATNYHVVAGGDSGSFTVHLPDGLQVLAQVVKVDPVADLALLELPSSLSVPTLFVNERPPELAQDIMVLGFPGVAHSNFTLTTEVGSVTALDRVVAGRRYIQTNANINPGNSGGPAIDACGGVVGIVVAKMQGTDRTNLLIPTTRLTQLVDRYLLPARAPALAARDTVDDFFQSLTFGEPERASQYLSRGMVSRMQPAFSKVLASATARAERVLQSRPNVTKEQLIQSLRSEERLAFGLALAIENGAMTRQEGLQYFAAWVSAELFRGVESYAVADVDARDALVRVRLEVRDRQRGRKRYVLDLAPEWGEWSIARFEAL